MNERFMRRAIALSMRGYPAPNPHVGCVIVQDDQIVGEGFHQFAGGPHAEVAALAKAGRRASGADVYVTLEPCNHWGRTGPCSEALIEAGVRRVAYAVPDPNPKAVGGAERLAQAGIEVESGLLQSEAEAANHVWLSAMRRHRPYVVLKAAASLDGRIALPSGESKWITSEQSRRDAHRLRAELGAVLVGAGTVVADDPSLTARIPGVRNQPLRVVLDPEKKAPRSAKVFDQDAPHVHYVAGAAEPGQVSLPVEDGLFDIRLVLQDLWRRGTTSILVEGGAIAIGSFVRAGLFDRLELYLGPKVLGAGSAWLHMPGLELLSEAPQLALQRMRKLGPDVRLTYVPLG